MAQTRQNQDTGAVRDLVGADQFLARTGQTIKEDSLPKTRQMMIEAVGEAAKAKGAIKAEEQKQQERIAAGEAKLLREEVSEGQRLVEQAKAERERRAPVLEPTKDNFNDFAAIFSLTSALAFAIGGKGRGSGMQALAALNGAMDGWNKGKKDTFDRNMKEFKAKMDEYKTFLDQQKSDLKIALDLGGKTTEAGRAALKEIVMRDSGGLVAANIEAEKYDGAIKVLSDASKGLQQIKVVEARAAATAANKSSNLSAAERKEKRGSERLLGEMKRLRDSFKDSFANKKFDTLGELENWTRERLLKDPAMANWWKSYENVAMPERHEMFGATLTGGERDAWRRSAIGTGNSSAVIRQWFDERVRLLENKLDQFDTLNDSRARPNREDDPLGIM